MPSIITSGAVNAKAFGYGRNSDSADVGDAVNYSVRFNSADTPLLSKAFVAPTSVNIYTLSVWLKRSALSTTQRFFGASTNHSIGFNTTDNLVLTINGTSYTSTDVFRDVAKPYNFVYTQSGTTYTIYVGDPNQSDGYRAVMTGTSVANTAFNTNAITHQIGAANSASYLDGYLADVCFVDGVAQLPTAFGRKSADTGAWVHKNPSGITWGTNGFRLQFNTGASASDLGTDTSGNGNTFTVTNLSVTAGVDNDWLTDTPTNTYATLNPLRQNGSGTFLNGNLSGTSESGTQRGLCSNMVIPRSLVVYCEVTPASSTTNWFGVTPNRLIAADVNTAGQFSVMYYASNGNKYVDGTVTAYGTSYTTSIIGIKFDGPANQVTFYKDTTAYAAITLPSSTEDYVFFMGNAGGGGVTNDINFGQRAFTNKATNAASAVTLCTANLPTPANLKGSTGFAAVTDTGTNVQTTLATARAGFSSDPYVEIFKNRSASEGWRVRFSADSSNYLDFSATAAKAAFPALVGGNNYVGYALRISSTFGTATGTVSHTSGAADTVTHNLGNARCWILLKREDSTSNWFMYHPSLTAGSLLYLNLANAQTADTSITSVGANSFQIGSGVATGTYRYLIVAEKDGFCKLTGHTGNSSTDGPFIWNGQSGAFELFQRYDVGQTNQVMDATRSTYNVADASLYPAGSSAENASGSGSGSAQLDFVSGGIKLRNNASGTGLNNSTGGSYIGVSLGGTAFKYSTAR